MEWSGVSNDTRACLSPAVGIDDRIRRGFGRVEPGDDHSNRAADANRILLRAVRPDLEHHRLDRADADRNPHGTLPLAGDRPYSDRGPAGRRRHWPAVRERWRSA